ncbi:hypothetical protein [Streptomyces sp. NPDC050428]|uniref:hypothetical protein n=1 Tax=Streptomyces sp. NPDC050428 TaxID=3155757 RepID=UPI003445F79D
MSAMPPHSPIETLAQDLITPATMFDPALTYYANGTRVVMRWNGGEKTGITEGMTRNGGTYQYQAVRFEDGATSNVAPHVLHRATPADVIRPDGVKVRPDGRGKWVVVRGRDYLGVIFDEGDMARGRLAVWAPFAGTRNGIAGFTHDPAVAIELAFQAWPVTAAEIAERTGAPLRYVLETAEAVTAEWQPQGRRAVLRVAAATRGKTKITREAAALVIERLETGAERDMD